MKSFKFLPVSYRITILILLVLYAEHIAACNWFKFNSKPSGHNINHKLNKSSNQAAHKKAGTNDQITHYIESQQQSSNQDAEHKEMAWKLLFEALGKISKSNNPVKSHAGSIQESTNPDATLKEMAWKLISEALEQMTETNNRDAATTEYAWKLIRKVYNQVTNYIHLKQGSDNEDSTIKDMAWKLISEALEKMFKANILVTSHTAATVYRTN